MKTIFTTTILLLTGFINATISFSQSELWGTTSDGGEYGLGAVFKTNYNGLNQTMVHSFLSPFPGYYPDGDLMQATNGKFYGYTNSGGGSCGFGNFFEYDLNTNNFNVLVNFDQNTGSPTGAPIQAANGKLYGLTFSDYGTMAGTLFEYDLSTQAMTVLSDFSGMGINCVRYGQLVEATNGNLYALADGGSGGMGAIFEYEIATNNLTIVYNFPMTGLNGSEPWGGLMQATNGSLYGMMTYGGVNDVGVLFEYDIVTSTLSIKHDFSNATGRYPFGTPMQASNGLIYGLTYEGGTGATGGTLYDYDPVADVFTLRKTFDGNTGDHPFGKLCEAPNGILYGMNSSGGLNGSGTLISYNPTTFVTSVEVSFDQLNGAYPVGSLTLASNGNLYGLTESGGVAVSGNMIEFNYNNSTVTPLFDFNEAPQGSSPAGALTQAANGKLYGITQYGGSENMGAIYEIDPTSGVFALVASFDTSNGGMPNLPPYMRTELCAASNGKLYGLTTQGGNNNQGSLFEFDPGALAITKLVDFSSAVTGTMPGLRMIEASDGKLYGVASNGAINNQGTLFSFDVTSNTFTKLYEFDGVSGAGPTSALTELGAGKLYGITRGGGANNKGTIFVYDVSTTSLTKLSDFSAATGNGDGTLYQASNGSIYGMVTRDGANSQGTIFTFDTTSNTITKLHDFDGNNSVMNNTPGSLTEVYPGKLYAMREIAGTDFLEGDLFEFDIASNTYTRLIDFECELGYRPLSASLTSVNTSANSMVWPGDINYDMTVDNVDFLWLGLAIGDSGPIRPGATTNWTGQPSAPWSTSYINTVNYKHADSNGDGGVTISDSVAISLNYNQTHPLRNQYQTFSQATTEIKLIANTNAIAPGSPVEFDIYLADISLPQDSIYGLAFSLNFDPALVDFSQTSLSFSPSVLGVLGTDLNSFENYFPGSGRVETALSRTNQANATNIYGVIGKLHLVASPLVNVLSGLEVSVSDITAITASGQTFSLIPVPDSVIVDPALLGIDDNNTISGISIFPNPASSKLQLNHEHTGLVKILISDSRGSVVYQNETSDQESEIQLQGLSEGVYFVQIMTEKSVINKKFIVKHP